MRQQKPPGRELFGGSRIQTYERDRTTSDHIQGEPNHASLLDGFHGTRSAATDSEDCLKHGYYRLSIAEYKIGNQARQGMSGLTASEAVVDRMQRVLPSSDEDVEPTESSCGSSKINSS